MNSSWLGLASALMVLGPCSARGQDEGPPKVHAAYLKAQYTAYALNDAGGECGEPVFGSEDAGGRVLTRNGRYILEGFGCELTPGTGLKVRCGRDPVDGRRLPTMEVHEFAISKQEMSVLGVMDLDDWSYCFALRAKLSQ